MRRRRPDVFSPLSLPPTTKLTPRAGPGSSLLSTDHRYVFTLIHKLNMRDGVAYPKIIIGSFTMPPDGSWIDPSGPPPTRP